MGKGAMIKRATSKSSKKHRDSCKRIISVTLRLALKLDWQEITLSHIATAANMPLRDLRKFFPSKISVLKAFNRQVDAEVIANSGSVSLDEAMRDRLFELLMLRFDALTPNKVAIAQIIRGTVTKDPVTAIIGFRSALHSMKQLLELAGVSTRGICGQLRVNGMMAVYLKAMHVWLKDDSPELEKTMANVDKSLSRVESILSNLPLGKLETNFPKPP